MRFCDITIAYNQNSGGVRTYIDEKRRFLLDQTPHEHLLIVPGKADYVERNDRSVTIHVASPLLPRQDSYRFFVSPGKISRILHAYKPDIIELGSYYLEPWAAFDYRNALRTESVDCLIGCYFHTDAAEAYVSAPLSAIAYKRFGHWGTRSTRLALHLAGFAEACTRNYIASVFRRCDLALAASRAQAERLGEYGVDNAHVVPLGVDLNLFTPRHRSCETRAAYGASDENLTLIYAGRLSTEKQIFVLIEALRKLPADLKPVLWMMGHGPLREQVMQLTNHVDRLRLLTYENDRLLFARILASADLYVTAGPHETFGLSVLEAQASGLPVIGVDAGALRDRVPPGVGYLGPPGDAAAMAENILRAAQFREALSLQALRHVEEYFSWNRTFERLLSVYAAKANVRTGLSIPDEMASANTAFSL